MFLMQQSNDKADCGKKDNQPQTRLQKEISIDERQSNRDTKYKRGSWRWCEEKRIIANQRERVARNQHDTLHRWTSAIIKQSKEITIIAPSIKENTKSARGDMKSPGANVETVAQVNRNALCSAPATAIEMLRYKAEEAGIPFTIIEAEETPLSIGRDLPAATKSVRKARRKLKEKVM